MSPAPGLARELLSSTRMCIAKDSDSWRPSISILSAGLFIATAWSGCSSGKDAVDPGVTCQVALADSGCDDVWNDQQPSGCGLGQFTNYQDGADLVRAVFYQMGGDACVYAADTHQLVGAWDRVDTPAFCNGTAVESVSGAVPADILAHLRGNVGAAACPVDGGIADADATGGDGG
jgi:hypothetical protein